MIKRKPSSSRANVFGVTERERGRAGAELTGPPSLPWGTVFSQADPLPRDVLTPLHTHRRPVSEAHPSHRVLSVAAGHAGGAGRGGASGGPAAGPAAGAHRVPPGPAAPRGQCGRCHPGAPEVPGGPGEVLDPTLRASARLTPAAEGACTLLLPDNK